MAESGRQPDLFGGEPPRLPEGFTYSPEFITRYSITFRTARATRAAGA
jgi:hypothetical protein